MKLNRIFGGIDTLKKLNYASVKINLPGTVGRFSLHVFCILMIQNHLVIEWLYLGSFFTLEKY